jgi:hypothetical protein
LNIWAAVVPPVVVTAVPGVDAVGEVDEDPARLLAVLLLVEVAGSGVTVDVAFDAGSAAAAGWAAVAGAVAVVVAPEVVAGTDADSATVPPAPVEVVGEPVASGEPPARALAGGVSAVPAAAAPAQPPSGSAAHTAAGNRPLISSAAMAADGPTLLTTSMAMEPTAQ